MNFRSAIKRQLHHGGAGVMGHVIASAYRQCRMIVSERRFAGRPARDVFTEIYEKRLWGHDPNLGAFYSGVGSHDASIVRPYVDATIRFLEEIGHPDVVDMGCGDFSVGSQLRPYCRSYIAADIVAPLIDRNIELYRGMNVKFSVVDLAEDALPHGDIVLVRQVFQHMSNKDIIRALSKIVKSYKYIVVSEHLPVYKKFPHNIDKAAGPDIRLYSNPPSGIVLTSPPFGIQVLSEKILCEVSTFDGVCHSVIRTTAYKLSDNM